MGTRGPAEKRTGRQRRKSTSKVVELQRKRGASAATFPPPENEWLVATKNRWAMFWQSDLAQLVIPETDDVALRRLFELYDERERTNTVVKNEGRLTTGSQGQLVLHPLLKYLAELDKEIRALEDRFGCTPMARLRVGAKFGEVAKSLEDLNRGFDNDDEEEAGEEDPRRKAIDI